MLQHQIESKTGLQVFSEHKLRLIFIASLMTAVSLTIGRMLLPLDLLSSDLDPSKYSYFENTLSDDANDLHRRLTFQEEYKNPMNKFSYTITRGDSYNMTYAGLPYRCPVSTEATHKKMAPWRAPLLGSLQPHLNFTTFVETNLKILVVGDSVAIQLGQLLEEAFGAIPSSRHVLHESWKGHEGMTISATKGGGAIANFRMTGMLLAKGEGKWIANIGQGWNHTHVNRLMQHPHVSWESSWASPGSFDVMIFRINHGWLQFRDITEQTIHESVQLAHTLFGVKKVILIDIPLNNNIKSYKQLEDRKRTNKLIHGLPRLLDIGATNSSTGDKVQVVTLKFAQFTDELMLHNAKAIGMNTSDSETYALERVGCGKFPLSIAQGCAEFVNTSNNNCDCKRNRISQDGMHWCLESLGGRLVAGITCLLSCFQPVRGLPLDTDELNRCQANCNSQFMSLGPVDF